jgi:mono/diheme cytochrome c family protein
VRRDKLLHLLIGAAVAVVVIVPLGALGFIKSGIYNVGASKPHTKLTQWITEETMIHSIRSHAKGIVAPARASASQVRRGFCLYETHCVACHGGPGVARELWVSGMEPAPPYLLDATHKFKPRELFWIAKNGIKMTGMPSWRSSMSDDELWEVVAFLEARPDPATYAQWRSARFCAPVSGPPARGPLSIPRP